MVKKAKQKMTQVVKHSAFATWFASRKVWQKRALVGSALVCIVVAVGGAVLYLSWLQNAERIVADSLFKAATSSSAGIDGSLKVASPMSVTTASLKSLGNTTDGQLSAALKMTSPSAPNAAGLAVQGSLVYAGDSLYFKVDDVQKLYDTMLDNSLLTITDASAAQTGKSADVLRAEVRQQYQDLVRPIIDRMAGKWIAVAPEDITGGANDVKQGLECVKGIVQRIAKDETAASEVRRLYEQHRFLAVKHRLNDDKDTIGYAVAFKSQQLQDFGKALETSKTFAATEACKQITERTKQTATQQLNTTTTIASADSGTVELRMRKDSHQLTKVSYTAEKDQNGAKTTTTLTAALTFDQPINQEAPHDIIQFREVKAAFDGLTAKAKAVRQ